MNKNELITAISKESGLTKVDAKKALDAFTTVINDTLKKGDKIALVGFGTWTVSKREARMGRNPQTNKEMQIPAKKVVKFKVGAELAKSVE